MIPQSFEYSTPKNLQEALRLLADGRGKALAGGMSLIPLMKLRLAAPEHVVDIRGLTDLNYIREDGANIRIGATATHDQIQNSPLIKAKCPLLAEAAACIGDPQVRNMGTLGGSVAHADPAADYPAALVALEAQFRVAGPSGERTIAAADFFLDSFTTALKPGDIILEVTAPAEAAGTGVRYEKLAHPASGFAVVGVAVRVRKAGGRIVFARIGVTGVTSHAYRASAAESKLQGSAGTADDLQKAAAAVTDGVEANSDLYASAEYRRHLAKVYAGRALAAAVQRAV